MQFKHVFIEHFGKPTRDKLAIILEQRNINSAWKHDRVLFHCKFYSLYITILKYSDVLKSFYNKILTSNDILKLSDDFFELLVILFNWRLEINADCDDIFDIQSDFFDDVEFAFVVLETHLRQNEYVRFANKLVYILEMLAIRSKNATIK